MFEKGFVTFFKKWSEKQTEKSNTSSKDFNQIENKILSHLENQLHIDDLQEKTQIDLNTLLHNLTFLEIKSAIKKVSANSYIKL